MANKKQLDILRRGAKVWNKWRHRDSEIHPDFSNADLNDADLSGADLSGADLSNTNLSYARLNRTNLGNAKLDDANLSYANLRSANLRSASLVDANLILADLSYANLVDANLILADLSDANLGDTNFDDANLSFANLNGAAFGRTVLGDVDLRTVKGLEAVRHYAPSTIGTNTLEQSQGDIPEVFLRGAGLSDTFIEYARALVQKPINYYTCFISYSSKDEAFAKRLHNDLQGEGVRCWFAPEDMKIGDKIRHRIDESIRMYDKLLIVLSHHSLASTWVENEVETAFDKEQQRNTSVLFPIKLDETIMQTSQAWAATIRRTRYIGNFTQWSDHEFYQTSFDRLLRDLKTEGR